MSLGNRIRTLRKSLGLSQPALAKKAGLGQSTISDLENDKKGTSAENLLAISKVLGTSQEYLLTGKYPLTGGNNTVEFDANSGAIDYSNIDFSNIDHYENPIFQFQLQESNTDIKFVEDIMIFCEGLEFKGIKELEKRIIVRKSDLEDRDIKPDNCIAFTSTDDAMFPTIKDKDIVYVDLGRKTIKNGKVFVICHGGLYKIRRLYQMPLGGVRIVCDNSSEYPEEKLTAQEIIDQRFQVVGWAWSWQSLENW